MNPLPQKLGSHVNVAQSADRALWAWALNSTHFLLIDGKTGRFIRELTD